MEIAGTSTLMSGRSTTILPQAPIKVRISRRQVVAIRCRRGRRSRRAQLTTLLLAITVSTQFPTSLVISCFRPIGDALIPLQAIRRRPLPPSTRTILRRAAATVHTTGAGINKQPPTVSYTNRFIPTIVSVTNPTQTHVINLLGRDITITLTATNYEYNWGDGTPNTITTSPGLVWHKGIDPNNDPRLIRHYYTPPQGWRSGFDGPYPHENREITLTTTWSGTATNPFTGETQTINGLVTTTETTGQFPLSHLVINNTDTWEEKQGH